MSQEGRRLTGDRKHTVRNTPLPETKKALLSFIGLWSYCRTWIPRFANMEGTFRNLLTCDMKNTDKVQWTEKAREQFDKAKDCIMNSQNWDGLRETNHMSCLWILLMVT